jgi:hypothetical protein
MSEAKRLAAELEYGCPWKESVEHSAAAELRRLDAEFTACYSSLVSQEEKNAALEAECEVLRKDADRYRWILRNYLSADLTDLALKAGNLDAAIDAAMGKEIGK